MLTYTLTKHTGVSLYEQLYRAVKADILSGRLPGGTKLPGPQGRTVPFACCAGGVRCGPGFVALVFQGGRAGRFVELTGGLLYPFARFCAGQWAIPPRKENCPAAAADMHARPAAGQGRFGYDPYHDCKCQRQ